VLESLTESLELVRDLAPRRLREIELLCEAAVPLLELGQPLAASRRSRAEKAREEIGHAGECRVHHDRPLARLEYAADGLRDHAPALSSGNARATEFQDDEGRIGGHGSLLGETWCGRARHRRLRA